MGVRQFEENSKKALRLSGLDDERGQGMVEFLLLLPVIIGMVVVLVRVNSAITTSIVNQKYARMMLFRLNANGARYPVLSNRADFVDNFQPDGGTGFNKIILGVASRPIRETENKADASVQLVARTPALARGMGPNQEEPEERGMVRVRTTIEMCTQTNVVKTSGGDLPLNEQTMNENLVLDFCAGGRT